MQVKLENITIGNFKYNAKFELDDVQTEEVLRQGVLRLLQGKPSGDWEKAILKRLYPDAKKRDEIKVKDEETGELRPFRRTDIPFSEADANALKASYENVEFSIGENEKGETIKSTLLGEVSGIELYEGGTTAAPKFAREKAFVNGYLAANGGKLASGETRTAASFALNRGVPAPTEPWDEDTEFLGNVKAWLTEYLKKQAENE
jgi:hypothetical protein